MAFTVCRADGEQWDLDMNKSGSRIYNIGRSTGLSIALKSRLLNKGNRVRGAGNLPFFSTPQI